MTNQHFILDLTNQSKGRVIYPDPEIERDVYVPQTTTPFPPELFRDLDGMGSMGSFDDQKQFFELFNSLQQQQNMGNTNMNANNFVAFSQFGMFDGTNNNENLKKPETKFQKFLNTKIHIGLLAMLTYSTILMPFNLNIFLIFLAWEIAEIFILRQHESNSNGILNVLFMLVGMSPTKVNIVLKWIQLLNKVLRDVAVFMFVFVLIHICRSGLGLVQLVDSNSNEHSHKIIDATIPIDDDFFENVEL